MAHTSCQEGRCPWVRALSPATRQGPMQVPSCVSSGSFSDASKFFQRQSSRSRVWVRLGSLHCVWLPTRVSGEKDPVLPAGEADGVWHPGMRSAGRLMFLERDRWIQGGLPERPEC